MTFQVNFNLIKIFGKNLELGKSYWFLQVFTGFSIWKRFWAHKRWENRSEEFPSVYFFPITPPPNIGRWNNLSTELLDGLNFLYSTIDTNSKTSPRNSHILQSISTYQNLSHFIVNRNWRPIIQPKVGPTTPPSSGVSTKPPVNKSISSTLT